MMLSLLGTSCGREESASDLEMSLVFENEMLDLGDVRLMESVVAVVTLRNQSDVPARLIDVQKSCSCSDWQFAPPVIEPGGTGLGKITVQVKTIGESGGWVAFQFAMGDQKVRKLVEFKSRGIPTFEVSPPVVDMTLDLRETEFPIRREGVIRAYFDDVTIESMSSSISDAELSFSDEPRLLDDGSKEFAWTYSLTSAPSGGIISEQLRFVMNIEDNFTSLTVPITGTISGNLHVSRPVLYMGIVNPDNAQQKELLIQSHDEVPFTIEAAWSDMMCIDIAFGGAALDSRHVIEVGVGTHDLPESGRLDGTLYLRTSLPGANRWRIPIKGFVQRLGQPPS